jgi:cytochrome c553
MSKQLVLLAALALTVPAAFADGDAANGSKVFEDHACAQCHGSKGISAADQPLHAPILAGQYKDYLTQALHEYKLNQRKGSAMNAMAAPLTDQDIKDLAEYLSGLPGPLDNIPEAGH